MKPKKRGPTIPRTVIAQMRERFIFNSRLRPDALAKQLPVRWLEPQIINGWSTVSFCILKLDRITIWPIPAIFNFATTSCAYRVGVLDLSGDQPEPSVYITDRNADLLITIRTAPLLFADAIPALKARMGRSGANTTIQLRYMDGQPLFSVELTAAPALRSEVFSSVDEFAAFIKGWCFQLHALCSTRHARPRRSAQGGHRLPAVGRESRVFMARRRVAGRRDRIRLSGFCVGCDIQVDVPRTVVGAGGLTLKE